MKILSHFLKEGRCKIAVVLACLVLMTSCGASGHRFVSVTPPDMAKQSSTYTVFGVSLDVVTTGTSVLMVCGLQL